MFDWDALKYLLAVSRAGSTLAAATMLRVNQTTVARQIDRLEQDLGLVLFERRMDGYRLTEQGHTLVALAQEVERPALALEAAARALQRTGTGALRVTTTELLATDVIAPLISDLAEMQPGLRVELVADDKRLDIAGGEVDVAIRVGSVPASPGVVRKRIGESLWAIYCQKSYAERFGVPTNVEQLRGHRIPGGSGVLATLPALERLVRAAPEADIALRCNSVPNLIAAIRSGIAVGPLPHFAAEGDAGLVRCPLPALESRHDIWLLYRESQRDVPHARAFRAALIGRFRLLRHRLAGPAAMQPV